MHEKLLLEDRDEMGLGAWTSNNRRKYQRSNTTLRLIFSLCRNTYAGTICVAGLVILVLYYLIPTQEKCDIFYYNSTYPLTAPIIGENIITYRIGIIADLDTNSKSPKEPNTWFSYFKKGYLSFNPKTKSVIVTWDEKDPVRLTTAYSAKDRGMELSELVVFDGRLLSFEDRTGLVYEIFNDKAIPWILLMDGDGKTDKGFKSEWATVKDGLLYVGSMGKEWTTPEGRWLTNNPMYVKVVSPKGDVRHLNWVNEYKRIRNTLGIDFPGYMIHESGLWSSVHQKWFFLPRRCSKEVYNEVTDERMGCSYLISADPEVYDLKAVPIKNSAETRGFSSFKFVPASDDTVIVALRTEELHGTTATYITSFTIEGDILLNDTLISDLKYEGLEFI